MLHLCCNLKIYVRATQLPWGTLGPRWVSANVHSRLVVIYTLPTVSMNIRVLSPFHRYRTLGLPYVVTLLFTLRLPHYLGVPKIPPRVISNVHSS